MLMFGAVCFHSSLTKEQSRQLELQQKCSLGCILGLEYRDNSEALLLTSLPQLDNLRQEACLKWAVNVQANPQHTNQFPKNTSTANTRHKKEFREYLCKGDKFYKNAVPSMVRSLKEKQSQSASNTLNDISITPNSGL